MPSISESQNVDLAGFTRVLPFTPPANFQSDQSMLPKRSPTVRFSAPFLPNIFPSSDTIRDNALGGQIPQTRIPVPPQVNNGSGSTIARSIAISSSSSSTGTSNPPKAQTASVTTSVLSPGGQFTGSLSMAKSYIVLFVSVNVAARVRLYSTAAAQTVDLSRPITSGAGFGTEQGIVGDMVLDTAPVVWEAQNMTGVNGDTPQGATAYLTVDNLSVSSTAISVSVVYVPLQS